ncbi:hypothetical protein [Streptomyces sp. NPDC021562]|uniref:hypothetical protein n=1 Tax=Streptomyces sp. NPDC021562 TaxID=3155121 RepID=UPI0010453D06
MPRFTEFNFGVSWVMGFFHQDGSHDGDTPAEIVANNLAKNGDDEALAVRRDAQILGNLPSETLEVLWEAGAEYMPSFELVGTGAEWTQTIVGLCDARLSAKGDARQLSGADTEDGMACLGAVVAEIEETRFLAVEVRAALIDCARRCTPDLALRVLLRAILCAPDASLSPDQYGRLEAIGSALQYGEFVVDDVKFMVDQG